MLVEPAGLALGDAPFDAVDAAVADSVTWLIDNAAAYSALLREIGAATRSICITQLAFDADCAAYLPDGSSVRLLDALVDAHRERNVRVAILLNESLLLDTATPLRRALKEHRASTIEVRGVSHFPQLLHAKLLIVDGRVAFLVGSPFVNGYWDDSDHLPTDGRRPRGELGGRPLHDVTVRLDGRAAGELLRLFDEWWSELPASDDASTLVSPPTTDVADVAAEPSAIRVARTAPRNTLRHRPQGHTDILRAMTRGIERAERLIYLEHQYLSSRKIIQSLSNALERSPELEVIAVLNQNPDVTAYRVWQNDRLLESGLLDHPRVGLFTLWSASAGTGERPAVNQVFVHSKVIVADDVWATAGSANADGVSLHSYGSDFASRIGGRVFRNVRNFDVNIVIAADDPCSASWVNDLRAQLWREHLGGSREDTYDIARGWVNHWRARAQSNIEALNAWAHTAEVARHGSFVLPYSTSSRPSRQLEAMGVHGARDLDLRYAPGWLEVHCSPNWIRNMFA